MLRTAEKRIHQLLAKQAQARLLVKELLDLNYEIGRRSAWEYFTAGVIAGCLAQTGVNVFEQRDLS